MLAGGRKGEELIVGWLVGGLVGVSLYSSLYEACTGCWLAAGFVRYDDDDGHDDHDDITNFLDLSLDLFSDIDTFLVTHYFTSPQCYYYLELNIECFFFSSLSVPRLYH